MELRDYAIQIIEAEHLSGKLRRPPEGLGDEHPGPAEFRSEPVRSAELSIADARAVKVPPIAGYQDLSQRRRILHALANHELQATELFAWALLAFPEAPKAFRRGLLQILVEEQEHCELYIQRLEAFGGRFGELPVTGHFWNRIGQVRSPIDFLCVMGLTFENANLDFAQDYARTAREHGDEETARAIDRVHGDEVRHVAFAWRWLERWKSDGSTVLKTYQQAISYPLGLNRARGRKMDLESRRQAGLDEEFLSAMEAVASTRPNGRER